MRIRNILPRLVLLALVLFSACGKAAFNVASSVQNLTPGGTFSVPPQADIVLIVDDTGSMSSAYGAIRNQFPLFLKSLDQTGYNYHATVIPMTTQVQVTQVVGSVYDVNRSDFKPAYPGDTGRGPGQLPASVFRTPDNYTSYVTHQSNQSLGREPTFETLAQTIDSGFTGTGFFRNNATTIFIFIGNGNDTSKVNFMLRPNSNEYVRVEEIGLTPVCQPTPTDPTGGSTTCRSQATSMNYYQNLFKARFPALRVYALVANSISRNCLNGLSETRIGSRYQSLATYFDGKSLDLCSAAAMQSSPDGIIGAVLQDTSSYLRAQLLHYQIVYLIIQPNQVPSKVTRLIGGDPAHTEVISQDATQPLYWTYEGQVTDQNTAQIVNPSGEIVSTSPASGNAIRFHINSGGKFPSSADTFQVESAPPGATNSVSR